MKRYDLEYVGSAYMQSRELVENDDGDLVYYDDVQTLRSKVDRYEKALGSARSVIVMCSMIDRSDTCDKEIIKIDEALQDKEQREEDKG